MAETETTTEVTDTWVQCPDCNQRFVNRSGLASHRRSAHGYVDADAAAKWKARKALLEARKQRNNDPKRIAKLTAEYKARAARAAPRGTGKYVCDIKGCGRRFQAPTALGYHKRVAHGIAGQYSAKHQKQKEARQKTLTPPNRRGMFACPECGREFRFAKALGKHRSSKHGVPGSARSTVLHRARQAMLAGAAEKPQGLVLAPETDSLICHCGKGPFKTISGLRIHQSTTHHEKGGELHGSNGTASSNDVEVAIAFWIGRATERAEVVFAAYAERVALPPAEFSARSLAVLSGSSKTLRARYRLPD